MDRIRVELGARAYPVLVGAGLASLPASFDGALGRRSLVVTSPTVAGLHGEALGRGLAAQPHTLFEVADGEPAKSLDVVDEVVAAAVAARLGRDDTIIAFGGGAVGDLAGLCAALYHRGCGFVQVPTTLLAQVDSAVGGKVAVNHPLGKNLIGAFHQPRLVVADCALLATLPARELRAGLGEVIKYALLDGDPALSDLERTLPDLLQRRPAALAAVVARCCRHKARVVARDERDRGERALLNLGHSFGHALETAYAGRLLHGEAVALGCVMAARLSQSLGWLPAAAVRRVEAVVAAAGLPTRPPAPGPTADRLLELMRRDKKADGGEPQLVLLRGLGRAELSADHPHAALVQVLREFMAAAA